MRALLSGAVASRWIAISEIGRWVRFLDRTGRVRRQTYNLRLRFSGRISLLGGAPALNCAGRNVPASFDTSVRPPRSRPVRRLIGPQAWRSSRVVPSEGALVRRVPPLALFTFIAAVLLSTPAGATTLRHLD